MDANQVFATGGASGLVGVIGYLAYRFFFSKHRIVSRCCGKEMSLEVDGSTPKANNIKPLVDEDTRNESRCSRERERSSEPSEGRNQERVSRREEDEKDDKGEGIKRDSIPESGTHKGEADTQSTDRGQS
jgi:hypothetical protein